MLCNEALIREKMVKCNGDIDDGHDHMEKVERKIEHEMQGTVRHGHQLSPIDLNKPTVARVHLKPNQKG